MSLVARRPKRTRACGKRRFRDHAEATHALHTLQRSSRASIPVRSYECEVCGGWHLTSQARWGT